MNQFKASINAKFDLGNNELLYRYIPTTSHLDAFENILISASSAGHQNSHLIIGAYGTGKSYLVTVIAGILSQSYTETEVADLFQRMNRLTADSQNFDALNQVPKIRYIPVILSGYEGNFREAIINSIFRAVENENLDIEYPGQTQEILSTIDRWEKLYPAAHQTFSDLVKKDYPSEGLFISKIKEGDRKAIDFFSGIYEQITFGSKIRVGSDHLNFINSVDTILSQLKSMNLGLVLIYDEFGRFLQNLDSDKIYQTMQDIQDLAELANNGSDNFQLVLVSHKDLNSYFESYPEAYREEFKRIEGRFKTYFIRSDQVVFASILKAYLEDHLREKNFEPHYLEDCIYALRMYDLFDLSNDQVEELIIKGVYPIHPVTLYLLSNLSSRFGQNERTLYTFVSDPKGLNGFLPNRNDSDVMYPDYLYAYFITDSDQDAYLSLIKRKVENNLSFISEKASPDSVLQLQRIYKFISLWEAAELSSKQRLNEQFINFAMGGDGRGVGEFLDELIKIGVVRFNRSLNQYETKEISPVNIDELISKDLDEFEISQDEIVSELENLSDLKFVRAFDYNRQKSMIRYAQVSFCIVNEYAQIHKRGYRPSDSEVVILILNNSSLKSDDLMDYLYSTRDNTIYCLSKIDLSLIESEIKKIRRIRNLKYNREFLSEYPGIESEIQFFEDDILDKLNTQLNLIDSFSDSNEWFLNGKKFQINDLSDLSHEVSDLMFKMYPKTPVVLNESFNKNRISAVQKKAAIKVIDSILEGETIIGSGPDFMIKYSVFEANSYNPFETSHPDSALTELSEELRIFLESASKVTDIIDFFQNSQYRYGIRFPLIPVLFTGLLKDVWDNLLFFNQNSAVMNLNGENIYKMFENPEGFTYRFHTYTDIQTEIISEIIRRFGFSEEDKGKPNHMKAGHGLYLWLKSLPRYSQITFEVPESLIQFRDNINYFSVDPIGAIDKLAVLGIDNITNQKFELSSFVYKKESEILNDLYKKFEVNCYSDLLKTASSYSDLNRLTSRLIKTLQNSNEFSVANNLSEEILGIPISQWSDNTRRVFEKELNKEIAQLSQKQVLDSASMVEIDGKKVLVPVEDNLSVQGENLSKRIAAMINAQNQRVSRDEIKSIIFRIFQQLVLEGENNGN